ncbi:hypothetical protein KIL84_004432 [Mauremys mutica]|uniref:Uncharacterized protein n=1 Tax=Mauremys mutica TaxID=74926 RepID=A0A9D4B764_9SAUR|nr:hypothetical protein KIL84_004432 [Mauremys mutica]
MGAFNVNKIKDFGEAAKREMLKDQHAFKTARRLSQDAMGKKVPWVYPKLIDLPSPLVQPGSGSCEKFTQAEREKGILQEIFLSKERHVAPPRVSPLQVERQLQVREQLCLLPSRSEWAAPLQHPGSSPQSADAL